MDKEIYAAHSFKSQSFFVFFFQTVLRVSLQNYFSMTAEQNVHYKCQIEEHKNVSSAFGILFILFSVICFFISE